MLLYVEASTDITRVNTTIIDNIGSPLPQLEIIMGWWKIAQQLPIKYRITSMQILKIDMCWWTIFSIIFPI